MTSDPTTNFLEDFGSLFKNTEVPSSFAMWAGFACLSAMLERRIWIDMNIFTVYPNMFIVFVADSGKMRKGTPIMVAQRILNRVDPGPKVLAQKSTPEAVIKALQTIRTDDPTKLIQQSCGGVVIAEELMTFLNQDTYQRGMGGLMIELWNCSDKFTYSTRGRGDEEIHFGHLSLLGATTIHSLRSAIPLQAMGDGFSSRVLFIYEDTPSPPVPRPIENTEFKATQNRLVLHLQNLASLEGEVTLTPDAIQLFDTEYIRFYNSKAYDETHLRAYAARRDKHWLKVAMCLMAARGGSLEITRRDLASALIALESVEDKMGIVFDRLTMTDTGSLTELIFNVIKNSPNQRISRELLLRKFSHRINARELSQNVETLIKSERIGLDTHDRKVCYVARG